MLRMKVTVKSIFYMSGCHLQQLPQRFKGASIAPKTLPLLTRCGLFRRLTDGPYPCACRVREGREEGGRWAEAAAAAATAASLTERALAACLSDGVGGGGRTVFRPRDI